MSSVETVEDRPQGSDPQLKLLDAPATATGSVRDEQRTINAARLFDFAELFAVRFDPRPYGTARPRRLRLTAPDDLSTAGGRQARRALLLEPDDDRRDTLVVGWVDVPQKQAELRTYESLAQYFADRFGRPLELPVSEYHQLQMDLTQFLTSQGVELAFLQAAYRPPQGDPSPAPPRTMQGVSFWMVGLLTGICLGYALFAQ